VKGEIRGRGLREDGIREWDDKGRAGGEGIGEK